ncbi:hypothetical protein LH128_30064 [Sphingomonas sp. LH128]|uniref:hypothetical protein n=1 Tax=Sphingomonas sp. LH128 TaxID=473781 RepID=UPI00027CAF26|nr:hypothetical protein [Sphingomonas sp. LH128]EJU09224.1 hypothetical protein LH128_30064 [Sphingomonas sp. LH128]
MKDTETPQWEGRKRHFTDPYRGRLPELERCMIRHRALEMILVIYHAEELKRSVVETVDTQKRWKLSRNDDETTEPAPEVPERKKVQRAFDWLVKEGVLTADERREMVKLIGRRNSIAHHLDQVTADLNPDSWVRDHLAFMPDRQQYDYEALDRLKAMRLLLEQRTIAKHYVGVISMRSLLFEATERALRDDLKRLDRRIRKLVRKRIDAIAAVNSELSLEGSELVGMFDPRWPDNRHHSGCLTPRGVEICYRLFDMGKSAMAVAHIMEFSLVAARAREKQWRELGGNNRVVKNLQDIPLVRKRLRYEDMR